MPYVELNETKTYCNPLNLPDCPKGEDPPHVMDYTKETLCDYRSVSDPSVLYENGKWYLYPSYGMAWISEDFVTWKHVRTTPYNMKYSPVVVPFQGRYLMTSHSNGLYESDSPLGDFRFLGDFILPSGEPFCPIDPALFVDDDGRLYLYGFYFGKETRKYVIPTGTYGVELDPSNPRQLLSDPITLFSFDNKNEWEHFGENRQDTLSGWIEGQWMLKKNGRYYLIYASSGTEYSSYCMAAYYSDEGPLQGFQLQKNNPILESRHGLIRGAGHGCVVEGPRDTLWAFYTISLAYSHIYERRIGMDLLAINKEGELYAPHGVTNTPQFGPGISADPVANNGTGLFCLTARQRAFSRVSSHAPGHEGFYALDDSMLTFWQPSNDDPLPSLTVHLQAPYRVQAARLLFREIGMDYQAGRYPGPIRYTVEGCIDNDLDEWVTLLDCRENTEDRNCDFRTFPAITCESVRLTLFGAPDGIIPGVIDFSVFGQRDENR
ncbi:glycoside hydrolase family 43 [Candidatus Colimorpha enterica]|uniref:Glycoside hydrolase family 43 n=1 Tax=Candidatus Colimorpha enterica TaxID=3083063 RepID=R6UM92_9BACT|nr:glycoside hydrolase family 43 [Candidatus Colimorpha enterica]